MALSTILRRSASRFIGGGNRIYGNLILPVPAFRQFSSSPCLSSKDNESLVNDAKRPSLDETLVNDLISQLQSLQRDIELLRNSYSQPLSAVKVEESLAQGEGVEESESVHQNIHDDSSPKGIAIESSNDEAEDCESDKSDNERETDENCESGDTLSEPDGESLPKSKENEELLKGIEEEILIAKTFMEHSAPDAVIPADFPFDICNHHSGNSIRMTQEYEGELVTVYVESPNVFMYTRQCNVYNEKKSSSYSMNLTVLVSDLSSKSTKIELNCGARREEIHVYSASDPAEAGHEVRMSDVNENLKKEFGKYLEARGITLSTTNFMYGYMLDKANKERLRILENIQKMVSA